MYICTYVHYVHMYMLLSNHRCVLHICLKKFKDKLTLNMKGVSFSQEHSKRKVNTPVCFPASLADVAEIVTEVVISKATGSHTTNSTDGSAHEGAKPRHN